jgi:hypothetical protein
MNQLEKIEKEFPLLCIEAMSQRKNGAVNIADINDCNDIGDLLHWSETDQGEDFWELVYQGEYDRAKQMEPHLFEEPEKWIPKVGEQFFRISERTGRTLSFIRVQGHWDEMLDTCYPTEAAALASIQPKVVGVDMAQKGADKTYIFTSEINTNAPWEIVDVPATRNEGYRDSDGPVPTPIAAIEPPHPHADSWVPAFGMDFSSAQHMSRKWVRL